MHTYQSHTHANDTLKKEQAVPNEKNKKKKIFVQKKYFYASKKK
jgi:hypothetical protein